MSAFNKKVAHISSVHTTYDNRIFFKECVSLSKYGYEAYLITPYERASIVSGVNIIGIRKPKHRFYRMTITTVQATRLALKLKPAIYHFHDAELLPWAFILSVIGKITVFDMHENLPASVLNKKYLPVRLREYLAKLLYFIEKFLTIKINIIYAEKSYCENYNHRKTTAVVLNMPKIDEIVHIKKTKASIFTLGYIGRIAEVRGSLVTLKALKRVKDCGIPVGFECVGLCEPAHMVEIKTYIKKTMLDNIRFHGYLKAMDGFCIMAQCHVGMALLAPVTNYLTSFPTKLFEYMALGIPVITSDFPLYREIFQNEECGFLVNPDKPDEVADAIQFLINNPEKSRCMGEKGRKLVMKRYNWNTEFKKLLEFYSWILNQKKGQESCIF